MAGGRWQVASVLGVQLELWAHGLVCYMGVGGQQVMLVTVMQLDDASYTSTMVLVHPLVGGRGRLLL